MRKISSVMLIVAGLIMQPSASAYAFDSQTIYFWEDARSFGWSDIPDYRYGNPPVPVTARMSLSERCARLVGRLLLRDFSGRTYSTLLEDACIRNGGRL